jgi:hypothetical protein
MWELGTVILSAAKDCSRPRNQVLRFAQDDRTEGVSLISIYFSDAISITNR